MMACTLSEYQQSILASGLNSPREGPSSLILNKTSRRSLLRLERPSVLTRFIRENTPLSLTFEKTHVRDYEILGWCPAGPVLPHGEKVPLGITIKILYGVDVLH